MYQIGIDVSKKKLDICLLFYGILGKRKTKVIDNDAHSSRELISWLGKQKCRPEDARIVLEATGTYHETLCDQLFEAGIYLSIVNPYRIREFAKGMGILSKNDIVDAYALACFGTLKRPGAWVPPPPEVRELKALLRRRDALLADVLCEQNRLEKAEVTRTPKIVMRSIMKILKTLEKEKKGIEEEIAKHIDKYPGLKKDMDLLTSIKSVGPQLGGNMLMVLRCREFHSAEQVAAYLGVVPVERRSGTSVNSHAHLSKAGPSDIRAKLFLAALTATRFNPHVKALYDRLLAKGKTKMSALGAAMRKLVNLCYGVLKTQQPYDVNYAVSG